MAKTTKKVRKGPKKKFTSHKCTICSKKFTEKAGLSQHIQTHSTERPFQCNICASSFKTKKYLSRHIKKVHSAATDHECTYCGKKFHYKSLMQKHLLIHTDERPYKCKLCGKGFNSNYSLRHHRYIHTDTKPFKCEFCEYACRDASTLRKHQERHMGVKKRYQCTLCDKSCCSKSRLKIHITEVHLQMEVKKSKCDDCDKVFKSKSDLNVHIKSVHKRAYACECEICGAVISNKYNLELHMARHMDYRPFKCNFNNCAKTFKDKGSLKKHIFIHYPEKHLQCDICHRRFSRASRLRLHLNQHKAKKKCVFCDYCGTGFYNKNYLLTHIDKKHLHRQVFACEQCGFETSNKPSLVMHIKSGHESELDRKCKICNKVYKKHIYLKAHYWKTHCVRYNMTMRRQKPKKRHIIIKEEPNEYIEGEFLDEIKLEVMSDTEEKPVEYNLKNDLNQYFTEQIIKPGSSFIKEKKDNNVKIDVKCQKEARVYLKKLLENKRRRRQMKDLEKIRREYNRRLKELSRAAVKTKIKFVRNNNNNEDNDKNETNDNELDTNININETNDNLNKKYEATDSNNAFNDKINDKDNGCDNIDGKNERTFSHTIEENDEIDGINDVGEVNDENDGINENIDGKYYKQDCKLIVNVHQCYVCFKLYESKEELTIHCQEHFDICNLNKLKKCPLCDYVTKNDLKRHMLSVHRINLKTWLRLKKNSTNFDDTAKNINIKVIPSVKSLNKQAYVNLDRDEKKKKEKGLTKKSLVKQNGEWIIKNDINTDYKKYLLPKGVLNLKCKMIMASDGYLDRLKILYRCVKGNGREMIFPCELCEKICHTLSALKLHTRIHQKDPKPFKKKTWQHKLNGKGEEKQKETGRNRYETPKPIRNEHKCDEELKQFYNNNVKGGDVEFWQFLKIFNKMSREDINDFPDLKDRKEFGSHNFTEPMERIEIAQVEMEKVKPRRALKRHEVKRRILLSKKEHDRRKLMIENLRRKNLESSI